MTAPAPRSLPRRALLGLGVAGAALTAAGLLPSAPSKAETMPVSTGTFPVTKTPEEWRQILDPAAYKVLRDHGTERAFTSPLNDEKRDGVFHCAGCDTPLWSSKHKFDSGTGWPSFWQPIDGLDSKVVGKSIDRSWFMTRTEVHCATCGGHHGHVFDDGPQPTGLRYCINGVALKFRPAA